MNVIKKCNVDKKIMNWRKTLIFTLLRLSGSEIPKALKHIERMHTMDSDELKKIQKSRLSFLLLHSAKHVPYYREILSRCGVVQNSNVNLSFFDKIPILTKNIIRQQGKHLCSDDYGRRKAYSNTSGGSTGEPVEFIQDKFYCDWNIANKIYYKKINGQEIGDKELRFWGSERDLLVGKEKFSIRFRNWLYNRKEFNTFRMSEEDMKKYVVDWNIYKPKWVEAYVQSIYEFACFIADNNLNIYKPDNGILTSAGTLFPHMKKKIEEVFNCKVLNRYGSREVGDMACGLDELKLSVWNHYLEIIKGKIYVTTLNNFSMPLIRYDIGDLAEFTEKWGSIKNIKGRINNMIKTSNGVVDSAAITSALYFDLEGNLFTSFSKYQLIQKKKDEFILKVIVKNIHDWNNDKIVINNVMKKILGENIVLNFNLVDDIPPLENGKYEYIRSEV